MYEEVLNLEFDPVNFDCSHFVTYLTKQDFGIDNGNDSCSRDLITHNEDNYVINCYLSHGYIEISKESVFKKGDVLLMDTTRKNKRYSHANYCLDDKLCISITASKPYLLPIKKIINYSKCLRLEKLNEICKNN